MPLFQSSNSALCKKSNHATTFCLAELMCERFELCETINNNFDWSLGLDNCIHITKVIVPPWLQILWYREYGNSWSRNPTSSMLCLKPNCSLEDLFRYVYIECINVFGPTLANWCLFLGGKFFSYVRQPFMSGNLDFRYIAEYRYLRRHPSQQSRDAALADQCRFC